jgi:transposase
MTSNEGAARGNDSSHRLDTSKGVFQLHGVDGMEQPVLRRKLRRGQVLEFFSRLPPALVAMEACGASHYWARELRSLGHEVAMIPPQYVKPYVQRGKSDAADAEAICEAASRPKLRKNFVPIKSPEQQGAQMLTRVRTQFIGRRTQLANSIRGYAAEFGFTAPKGISRLQQLLIDIRADATVPGLAMELIEALATELARIDDQIATLDKKLMQLHRSNEMSRRLATILDNWEGLLRVHRQSNSAERPKGPVMPLNPDVKWLADRQTGAIDPKRTSPSPLSWSSDQRPVTLTLSNSGKKRDIMSYGDHVVAVRVRSQKKGQLCYTSTSGSSRS